MRTFREYDIASVCELDTLYPKGLKEIVNKPSILYYKGDISIINQKKNIAVIGTRKMSEQGGKLAYETGREVANKGINLVNGLALGCDTAAIKGALSVNGKCIAIMPCGLNQVQPRTNTELAEEILAKGGCIISEYPADREAQRYQYVERDRIQSGISQGVMIIETDAKGGTMHTADFSLRQKKRLACYYYKLVQLSSGNQLLAQNKSIEILKSLEEGRKYIDYVIEEKEYQQMTLF